MNSLKYFQDLSGEFQAVQNRVRSFIGNAHWGSDGAWKESVLRTVIRRYLPPSFTVGTGFILNSRGGISTQMDILICDDSAPFIFRDGDFLIATSHCVRAAIEVKTSLSKAKLEEALVKLNDVSRLLRQCPVRPQRPFIGLFCYDPITTNWSEVLTFLQQSNGQSDYEIQALCFGGDQFCRFWEVDPRVEEAQRTHNSWHAYNLPGTAPGYFVHNLIEYIFPHAVDHNWYPGAGKEPYLFAWIHKQNPGVNLAHEAIPQPQ